MVATEKGRTYALARLRDRRKKNGNKKRIDNASLPAGSPMFFYCVSCGDDIVVPEGYINKPDMCLECEAMRKCGWLE